jgi:hypothetical protein
MPVNVQDKSGPLIPLGKGGLPIEDSSTQLVAARAGRIKVNVMNAGSARMYIAVDEPAVAGEGDFIEPGGQWYEYTTAAVNVIHEDAGQEHLATFQEYGA